MTFETFPRDIRKRILGIESVATLSTASYSWTRVLGLMSSGVSEGSATIKTPKISQEVRIAPIGSWPDVSVHCIILVLKDLSSEDCIAPALS